MIYAMSDIHGNDKAFFDMLEKINFSEDDILIICGDVVDRGAGGLIILDYCMQHKNVELIKGNHEVFMETYLEFPQFAYDWQNWGGIPTMDALKKRTSSEIYAYYNYLCNLPLYKIMEINDIKYAFTHTGYYSDTEISYVKKNVIDFEKTINNLKENKKYSYLISTELFRLPKNVKFDCILVCGHIPTISETFFKLPTPRIYDAGKFIDIDCGSGYVEDSGRLACLRLNDMKEFYV